MGQEQTQDAGHSVSCADQGSTARGAHTFEVARTMINLPQPLPERYAGARFRPCKWSDIYDRSKPDTWGIEVKPAGKRRYTPVGWQMQVSPFASKAEAQAVCGTLNEAAKAGASQ